MTRVDPERRRGRIVLSGGLARRLPARPGLLAAATGCAVTEPTAIDESLLGLRARWSRAGARGRSPKRTPRFPRGEAAPARPA